MKKSTPLWCEDCRLVCFETGLGKPMLTLNDPNGFKNTTNVYSIHLELRMALPCQISNGKWKYVNPCLDFLGIPDQRRAYVKRQARPRWTYVRRSSVTPDLFNVAVLSVTGDRWFPTPSPHDAESPRKVLHGGSMTPHDDVIKWKHFPRYWLFVWGIHRSRWIPHTKPSDAELGCFLWSAPE